MNLPKDPVMLLSLANTQIRDIYPSLEELAAAHLVDARELQEKLAVINYEYNEKRNQFV